MQAAAQPSPVDPNDPAGSNAPAASTPAALNRSIDLSAAYTTLNQSEVLSPALLTAVANAQRAAETMSGALGMWAATYRGAWPGIMRALTTAQQVSASVSSTLSAHAETTRAMSTGLLRVAHAAQAAQASVAVPLGHYADLWARMSPSVLQAVQLSAQARGAMTQALTTLGVQHQWWLDVIRAAQRSDLPPNLRFVPGVTAERLEVLANEGITLWAVPRPSVAVRLLQAVSSQDRRRVLGQHWRDILEDCSEQATLAAGGANGDLARLLERAIAAIAGGHVEAGQALAASVLDTLRHVVHGRDQSELRRRVHHFGRKMDHFSELDLADAMTARPIWFAYRPYDTPGRRAVSPSFSRHGTAHWARGRQINRRNAVQAVMLVASLLNYAGLQAAERTA